MGYPEFDAQVVADRIGIPLERWAGNCHGISEAIRDTPVALPSVTTGDAKLVLVRGHWVGPIDARSYFSYRIGCGFVGHSWLQLFGYTIMPKPDMPLVDWSKGLDPNRVISHLPAIQNPIIDPTRFAFDGRSPYIYMGPSDHYDAGGNLLREFTVGQCPTFEITAKHIPLRLPAITESWISREIDGKGYPYGYYTFGLCMWLANLPLRRLGQHAGPIFRALVEVGQGACIPIDNRNMVLGDGPHG